MVAACAVLVSARAEKPAAGHHGHGGLGVKALDVYSADTSLHLLLAESHGHGSAVLLYRASADGGENWSAPERVDGQLPAAHSPHRGMDPQIAASRDRLIAVWMTKGTGFFESGPMATAISADGGKTWQAGPNPADDNSSSGHGFIDVVSDGTGAFHLTWLDSRDGRQGLRYARSTDGGRTWSKNATVKAGTCECCWNTLRVGPDGRIAILFRDKDPRDMSVAVSLDRGENWQPPVRAGAFDWKFDGCPHVGGGLAIAGAQSEMHALVWNGSSAQAGVFHARSADAGKSWSAPKRLGGNSASRPDLGADGTGRLAATWDAPDADGTTGVHAAFSADGGSTWQNAGRLSAAGRRATHPRVVPAGDGFRAFWTEATAEGIDVWSSARIGVLKP